jgi:ABC-type transport system involved in cytochrome c biogenesis permease component
MRVNMSYLSAIMILTLVVSPVLIPMLISGVHAAAGWRRKYRPRPKSIASEGRVIPQS